MPFGLQPIHLVVVFVVALLIFGPRRLPELGRGVGKAINEFRKGTQEMTAGLQEEMNHPSQATAAAGATSYNSMSSQAGVAPVSAASGNYCTSCGSPNPAEARFCNKCGTPLSA